MTTKYHKTRKKQKRWIIKLPSASLNQGTSEFNSQVKVSNSCP